MVIIKTSSFMWIQYLIRIYGGIAQPFYSTAKVKGLGLFGELKCFGTEVTKGDFYGSPGTNMAKSRNF